MSGEGWDPAEHPNEYRKSLKKLLASRKRFALEERAEGKDREQRAAENVVDLMEALKKSLGQPRKEARRSTARRRGAA
jgi:non-homologous end joining protein Ku